MSLPKVVLLTSLALVCLFLAAIGAAGATDPDLSAATSLVPPSPADEAAIKAVIDQSFWLDGEAARTFDVSQFSTVYANDSSIGLSQEQSDLIARVTASNPPTIFGKGFLDYKRAFYYRWETGATKLEQLQATARSEGREVTSAELRSIADRSHQPAAPRRTDPNYHIKLDVQSVAVDGDHAEIIFDSGLVQERMYLLRTPEGWRIDGERLLNIHF